MISPKRRVSKARRDKRRAHDRLSIPVWVSCSNCNESTRPHFLCRKCGFYKGKKVIEIKKQA